MDKVWNVVFIIAAMGNLVGFFADGFLPGLFVAGMLIGYVLGSWKR